jgi:hypothetical protein
MQKTTKNFMLYCIYFLSIFMTFSTFAADGKVATTVEGIKFVTGGIGEEEAAAMRRVAKDFSLNLVFSEGTGGKITGINAVIYNEQGQRVFYIKNADPLLYVNLPSGKYRVLANYKGEKQGLGFELEAHTNKKIILNWKNSGEAESTADE